ncbi:cytochrome P450 1B1 [Nelusetta ayraudi]|uniref:cytochrome P450 1B1 n=1 Tax=Nelusetta ayraudi TaxID=303726 RepID=UPI003F6E677C
MHMMNVIIDRINPTTARDLLVACAAVLLSAHLWRWLRLRLRLRLRHHSGRSPPPGPFAWPLIGNAAQLGKVPHLYFARMARRYGDVFQIRLGGRAVVVLNGPTIRQALVKQGPDFAGRPDFTSFQYVSGGKSLAFSTTTDWWKTHRKVAHSTVRMFSSGKMETKKTFEFHVLCEFRELLQLFVHKSRAQRSFDPTTYLVVSTANIMSAVCFGKRYSYEDEEFRQVVGRNDQFTQTVGAGSIVDVMPWLQYFPNPIKTIFENFKRLNLDFGMFILDKVIEHRKSIQSSIVRDMTDAFIVALDQLSEKTGRALWRDFVGPTIGDIFGASQDTLSTALQWIILVLVKYPEMQTRLQQEVDRVVDRTRLPSIEDQQQLPYVMAFIYEVMRFTSFVPLTIPHSTTVDTTIMGYAIPKDTVVFVNQWSVNHDPASWSEPETFDPERFLNPNGTLNKDLTSNVLIFSLGKRRCIGEDLSKLQLFLFTSMLAHQCRIDEDPARPATMDFNYGLTLKPHKFNIQLSLRDDMTLLDKVVAQLSREKAQEASSPDS